MESRRENSLEDDSRLRHRGRSKKGRRNKDELSRGSHRRRSSTRRRRSRKRSRSSSSLSSDCRSRKNRSHRRSSYKRWRSTSSSSSASSSSSSLLEHHSRKKEGRHRSYSRSRSRTRRLRSRTRSRSRDTRRSRRSGGGSGRRNRDLRYDRRSPSMDQERIHRPHHDRSRRYLHRRSRSFSSFSSSSSSTRRSNRQRPPRPRALAINARTGVVSDDDDHVLGTTYNSPSPVAPGQHGKASSATGAQGGRGRRNDDKHPAQHSSSRNRKDKLSHDSRRNRKRRESAQSSSQNHDDTVGHFWGGPGTIVADKYRIVRELGIGTFGRVVECLDLTKSRSNDNCRDRHYHQQQPIRDDANPLVAIKMVRKVKRYYDSALIEADIVADVNRRGGPRGRGASHFAIMYDAFNFHGHYCLVFESLGPSLYDYLKRNEYQPFPMSYVRDFSRQLLEAIEFLHSFRLIHTDLKPENILVTKCREINRGRQKLPESTRIKVIDFGGATYDDDKKSSVVNTRQYRAPEVILGCGWSMPSDLWSAGCIMAELYQGDLLFATHDNLEHLALIERIIGPFPRRMLQRASELKSPMAEQAFDSSGRHRMERVLSLDNASHVRESTPLESVVRRRKDAWFLDLLRRLIVIDPERRSTARDALRNSFG